MGAPNRQPPAAVLAALVSGAMRLLFYKQVTKEARRSAVVSLRLNAADGSAVQAVLRLDDRPYRLNAVLHLFGDWSVMTGRWRASPGPGAGGL